MLLIRCPYCGSRDELEFVAGGEANRVRPSDPMALGDVEWADFLFMRRNAKGAHLERWNHAAGCRRWFTIERDNVTHAYGSPSGDASPQGVVR